MKKWRLLLVLPLIVGALYLRSLASWRPQKLMSAAGYVSRIIFSRDGKTVLIIHPTSSGPYGVATALDVESGFRPRWQRENSLSLGLGAQFYADDSRIWVDGGRGTILDVGTGETIKSYEDKSGFSIISPNGKWLVYHLPGAGIFSILPQDEHKKGSKWPASLKTLGVPDSVAEPLAFSPDGKTLAVAVGDENGGHLDFYDVKSWKRVRTWNALVPHINRYQPRCLSLRWSRNGQFLVSAWEAYHDLTEAVLQRASDGQIIANSSGPSTSYGHPFVIEPCDNERVLSIDGSAQLYLRKAPDLIKGGEKLIELPDERVTSAALSPDGSYVVAGTLKGNVYWKRVK